MQLSRTNCCGAILAHEELQWNSQNALHINSHFECAAHSEFRAILADFRVCVHKKINWSYLPTE
jgi:hypothetical protein